MKRVYVSELNKYLDEEIQEFFYLLDVQYTNSGDNQWQMCIFCDRTGKASGKVWSQNINPEWEHYYGRVVQLTGKVEIFRDIYCLNIFEIKEVPDGEYDNLDFVVSISENERQSLITRFKEMVHMVTFEPYQLLLNYAYGRQERFSKLCELPADRKFYYAYRGGWLERTVEIAELSIFLSGMVSNMQRCIFNNSPAINHNLLITGALMHDIGKLSAIKTGVEARTTRRGYLVGNKNDSIITITVINNMLPKDKKIKDLTDLLHIVAAVSGEDNEIKPQTAEGMILAEACRTITHINAYYSVFASYDFDHPDSKGREIVYSKYYERMLMRGENHV